MDTRSRSLVEGWDDELRASIRARSGWSPAPGLGLATIAWLNGQHLSAARWSSVDDYVMSRLCGEWLTNPSNAAGMQLMDVATLRWSDDLCGVAGVSAGQLSKLVPSGEIVGSVQPGAADVTGLRPSTPVVMGGHDQACAAFGLGITEPGEAVLSLGTAWVLTIVVDQPVVESLPDSVNLSPGVLPGRWSASRYLGGLGADIASTMERFGPDAPESVAVLEGCISVVREALELAAEANLEATSLVLVGGGTRIERLVEGSPMRSASNLTVRADASWPAVGAAKLAAHALGWQGGAMETSSHEQTRCGYHHWRVELPPDVQRQRLGEPRRVATVQAPPRLGARRTRRPDRCLGRSSCLHHELGCGSARCRGAGNGARARTHGAHGEQHQAVRVRCFLGARHPAHECGHRACARCRGDHIGSHDRRPKAHLAARPTCG